MKIFRNAILSAIFTIMAFTFMACDNDISIPKDILVYANSFESLSDTADWVNNNNIMIVNGGAPYDGGNYSLYVKSNVDQPATSFNFSTQIKFDKFKLVLWGKMQDSLETAQVKLEPMDGESAEISSINISGKDWQDYSAPTFVVPESGKFRLRVYTPAKENAGVYLDKIGLIRIE